VKSTKALNRKFAYRSIRLPRGYLADWKVAAAELNISQSEFLRRALQEKARQVLGRDREHLGANFKTEEAIMLAEKEKAHAARRGLKEREQDEIKLPKQ
jgi:hypothetical protein